MAGTYGHEKTNLENSTGFFELSWQSKLDTSASELVLATGFSCRSHVKRFSDLKCINQVLDLIDSLR